MDLPAAGYDAVLLVGFGGPERPEEVMPFLRRVTAGREVPEERLAEVAERYLALGGVSPINGQCRRLRAALENELARQDAGARHHGPAPHQPQGGPAPPMPDGERAPQRPQGGPATGGLALPVYWGNRNWHPLLADTLGEMADDGVRRALAIVTSAYSSYSGCRQYLEDIEAARAVVGAQAPVIDKVRPFFDHPGFVEPWADALRDASSTLADPSPAVVFTAHSIPADMAEACDYEAQLRETARLIAERSGTPTAERSDTSAYSLAWQSRSGPPQARWLGPDICDELRRLAAAGTRAVAIAPIGFVSDHMEVISDLDHEARRVAESLGMELARAEAPGTKPDPRFVAMLADLVIERLDEGSPRAALGTLGVRPDRCPAHCCPPR